MLAGKTNTEQDVVRGHMTNELLQRFKFDKALFHVVRLIRVIVMNLIWKKRMQVTL